MIYQIIPSLITLIVGSVLTFCVTYFSLTMTRKGEKNKIVREKLEEAYLLLNVLKHWLRNQYYLLDYKVTKTDTNKKYFDKFTNNFWHPEDQFSFEVEDAIVCECPIEKIHMLISLYAQSLKKSVSDYEMIINSIKLTSNSVTVLSLMEPALTLSEIKDIKQHHEDLKEEDITQLHDHLVKYACYLLHSARKQHMNLEISLEKLIVKI